MKRGFIKKLTRKRAPEEFVGRRVVVFPRSKAGTAYMPAPANTNAAHLERDFFIWRHFLRDQIGTVIVLPSPHGAYKSGISYSDACAMGQIYARLQNRKDLDVRSPELLGHDIGKNLILIAGKKANPITRDFQSSSHNGLTFDLEDGVIYDKEKQVVVTSQYVKGETKTIDNLTADYGLIVYTNNPFDQSTKVLQLAGIRGSGTLAAAIAVTEERIAKLFRQLINEPDISELETRTVEILVKACASHGRVERKSLSIEKIKVSDGLASWNWESEEYRQLKKVIPHRVSLDIIKKADQTSMPKVRIDNQEIQFARSPDRLKLIYLLTKKARDDYLLGSENEGWVNPLELAEGLWQIKLKSGVTEIPSEIERTMAGAVLTWARHLEKQGKLRLDETITFDQDYVHSEIFVVDFDVKKKIADLVYLINHEEKNRFGSGFQLIASQPGHGYRINIHPALIFIGSHQPSAISAQQ